MIGNDLDISTPVLFVLRGLRNGAYYGTKIRAPHAFVMTMLFHKGTIQEKIRAIVNLTYQHTKNLAVFVAIYKALLLVLRGFHKFHQLPIENLQTGKPAVHWHAAVAGAIGAYFVWANYSSVNYQIVMYLFSRIIIASIKLLAQKGVSPFSQFTFSKVYPGLAISVWAIVMWLFEAYPHTLHPSLKRSMDFLYNESNSWKDGAFDFLPSPATAIICAAKWVGL